MSRAFIRQFYAEHLKRLTHEGDLDRVSAFLEEVKEKGGVI